LTASGVNGVTGALAALPVDKVAEIAGGPRKGLLIRMATHVKENARTRSHVTLARVLLTARPQNGQSGGLAAPPVEAMASLSEFETSV